MVSELVVAFDTRGFERAAGKISEGLSMPGMEMAARGDDSLVSMRRARARASCCPMCDLGLWRQMVQETAEVLSHQIASWVWVRSNMVSKRR